jgi:hypothetical protein
MDENAQASLFDAVMFFIVMMIASTLIFIFSNQAFQTQEVMSREDMMRYTDETREAILQSTVYETWYQDINGNIITRPPGSTNINDLLLEELALLDDGVPKEHFKDGFENNITNTMDKLVGTGYNYVLQASYTNESSQNTHEIYLSKAGSSGDIPDRDVTTSQWSSPMVHIGKPGNAAIKLSIWRA